MHGHLLVEHNIGHCEQSGCTTDTTGNLIALILPSKMICLMRRNIFFHPLFALLLTLVLTKTKNKPKIVTDFILAGTSVYSEK